MEIVIETGRLLLRKFTIEDAELVLQLNRDEEVTRYTGDPVKDLDHARMVLEQSILPQYAANGFGRWAVLLKPSLEFIGWCGLKFRAERNEIDLGYRFKTSAWGKGFATEAAAALIGHCFEAGFARVTCGHFVDNPASGRVIAKLGFQCIGSERLWCEARGEDVETLRYERLNETLSRVQAGS